MGSRKDQIRLRIRRNDDGSRQVIDCEPKTASQTLEAHRIESRFCPKCFRQILRSAYHEVNGELYHHPDCTKAI